MNTLSSAAVVAEIQELLTGTVISYSRRGEPVTTEIAEGDWDEFSEVLRTEETLSFPGLGIVWQIERYGGSGQGSEYWVVFGIQFADGKERTFKLDGWYSSYDGGSYDPPILEVFPKRIMVTEWVSK